MTEIRDLHMDCRHFRWDRPCAPHKAEGVHCPGCTYYDPIKQRLAIVKLAAVGDVLRTTAFLPAIRRRFPNAWITWVTSPAAVTLFAGNELVDEVWTPDDPRLRLQAFDSVFCPDADPQTAALAATMVANRRVGFFMTADGTVRPTSDAAAHWFSMGIDDERKRANTETYQSLVARVLELDPAEVREPILVPSPEHQRFAAELRAGLHFAGPLVGINTGAGHRWERKRWTVPHQKALIERLSAEGIAVWLMGGPEETGTHAELVPDAPKAPVVGVGTDHEYRQFAALVEQCDLLVTGDTMALHVACARKVPVVALFGPTSLAEIELYGRGEKIAPDGLDCLGCYLPTCTVDPHCQERITPDIVHAAVRRILS